MLQLQYLRGIHVINNFIGLIIGYVQARSFQWRHARPLYNATSSMLLVAMLHSLCALVYARRKAANARSSGNFYVPLRGEGFVVSGGQAGTQPKMGVIMSLFNLILDTIFALTLVILAVLGIRYASNDGNGMPVSVCALIASLLHVFLLGATFDVSTLLHYKLNVEWVPRQQTHHHESAMNTNDGHKSEASSMQEPEEISPRPYRGSPSNKPQSPAAGLSSGPIRLTEPTEGDALIADHD